MPKLKEVLSSEVHWLIGDWNTRDQANTRIRQLLGPDAAMLAPVQVTHGGYFWSADDPHSYSMLSVATEAERKAVEARIDELRQKTIARFPAQKGRIEQIFSWPNDDFVFWRRGAGSPEVVITGWGFANYNRARGGTIKDIPDENKIHEVSLSFTVDGLRRPLRAFDMLQGVNWNRYDTDAEGVYALGRLTPGEIVRVRDIATGREFTETIGDDTTMLELDVTEYADITVNATRDNGPVDGDEVSIAYGHRSDKFPMSGGTARRRLPWLEGEQCSVGLRGQKQTRELEKDSENVFRFDFTTARMRLTVGVSGDGQPIAGEPVDAVFEGAKRRGVTGDNGTCSFSFDRTAEEGAVVVSVRDRSAEVSFRNGDERVDFVFDTPEADIFKATVRTVDLDGKPVPFYPITIDTGKGPNEFLTNAEACAHAGEVRSGDTMTVADATDPSVSTVFTLDSANGLYDFVLPYRDTAGDCTLRVIELDGKPSAGTTVILNQDGNRAMGHLDDKGEMTFSSEVIVPGKPVKVNMYSQRRTFPELSFTPVKDEKEYELKEVAGPTPWWKIAGEIALALGIAFCLTGLWYTWYDLFRTLPNIFA